ncbi:hypothetical protein SCUCBS95973_007772 [Sporothrix curviconia]|uniref:Nineteen complex-related protein 2-domain-containing protein n=1 Tax=Sporothrix curviconia TaxID=1260050 RepID=A0ABP0CG44_9PEZI
MSLFTKRKGRRISTFEDEDEPPSGSGAAPSEDADTSSDPVVQPIRFGKRQLKQSALRRSINVNDNDGGLGGTDADESSGPTTADEEVLNPPGGGANDNDEEGPVVVRPALGRSGSRRNKKRLSTASTFSRLSFGGGFGGGGDDNDGDDDSGPVVVTPNKRGAGGASSLTQRVLETNAFRKSLSGRLPTRHRAHDGDDDDDDDHGKGAFDDDRPRYSQAYLDELQSSTPNTPQNLASLHRKNGGGDDDGDLMDLDPSELDGAMVVDASELGLSSSTPAGTSSALSTGMMPAPVAKVLTETEIQERKNRRARRALEGDYNPDADDDEDNGEYISLLTDEQKKKKREKERTRLVREDEDLGEGYDEFVEDKEALSIGRKAERAARRKRKEEMAALIDAAEMGEDAAAGKEGGAANDSGDDSEAERRAAYDAAQTRAGMEGLHHRTLNCNGGGDGDVLGGVHGSIPIPRMRPLPDLATCLKQMQSAVEALEVDAAQHRRKLNEVEQEKAEITAREAEVQAVLDAAAAKYQTVLGGNPAADPSANNTQSPLRALPALGQSPLRPFPPVLASDYPVQRGLESLGTTPTRRPNPDDVFGA